MATKKVFIGVGHGGADPGAVKYVKEADANLNIALAMYFVLNRHGVKVQLSRWKDEDDPVSEEIKEANAYAPDIAVDVHNNAGGGDGFEAMYQTNAYKAKSYKLAQCIEKEVKAAGQNSRGMKTKLNSAGTDYFGFLRQVKAPAVIVEGFFVDNTADAAQYDTKAEQQALGLAYAKGILAYLGITFVPYTASGTTESSSKVTATNFKGGEIYKFPLSDIAYIGYFPSVNLAANKGELMTAAYARLKYDGKAPDIIMNAELFNSNMTAASGVTDEGKVHRATETLGIGFMDHQKPVWSYANNQNAVDWLGGYPALVNGGQKAYTTVPAGLGGSRARTALALSDSHFGAALLPESPGCTLNELTAQLISMGFTSAINLDGGGSTQGVGPAGKITSTRLVRGFVAIWLKSSGNQTGGTITGLTAAPASPTWKAVSYKVKVITDVLNVRAGPDMDETWIATVKRNDIYTIVEEQDGWGKLKSGKGWIYLQYTERVN